jgi:5-methyltetrahydropteroyltriglutamate--homocysteine methyltransferase
MDSSKHRILTTHVGSLPRPAEIADGLFARENGTEGFDASAFESIVSAAVETVVGRQKKIGIDIVSDGEMSKISYATYIKDRLSGFDGDSPRNPPQDLEQFPDFLERLARGGGTPSYRRPMCVGEIHVKDNRPMEQDIGNMKRAVAKAQPTGAFMNAASPGVIALFQPNHWYASQDKYLEALANAMRSEYEAIVGAGFILQVDSPDLGLGRHMMFKDMPERDYIHACERHVEWLNHALLNIPREAVRMHVCWGNYEGPHHCDAPFETVFGIATKAKIGAILFEAANPRHAHEWTWFENNKLPDDLTIIPGCIDSTTNFIEHPELVAQRITRFANLVGRERVVAGTDCGFGTFAGFGAVAPEIAWAKLGSLAEGARIATKTLFGES